MTDKPGSLNYYSQLDGLRCFAVVSVMIGHWIAWESKIEWVQMVPWGRGVILFFVLSGYLISNILFSLKEKMNAGDISLVDALKTFYIRRFLRIFPAYYLLVIYLLYINHANTRQIAPWLLTYTSNLLQCKADSALGDFTHFWSLAVEEQFYLIWPLIILMVREKYILRIILLFISVSFISRLACYLFIANWQTGAYFTLNLFFPLCLGALMAYSQRYSQKLHATFNNYALLCFFVLFYALVFYVNEVYVSLNFFRGVLDEYLFSIAIAFIIYKAAHDDFKYLGKFILSHEIIVYIGKISYGLYLYHLFVPALYWNYLAPRLQITINSMNTVWVFFFIIALVLAICSYHFIEKPFNNLKKRFSY